VSHPKPWLFDAGAPEAVRSLLDAASADGPSAEQLERLAARVAPAVGVLATALTVEAGMPPVAPVDPVALTASKGALTSAAKVTAAAWFKAVVAVGVIGLAGYGAVRVMPREQAPRARRAAPLDLARTPVTAPVLAPEPAPVSPPDVAPVVVPAVETAPDKVLEVGPPPSEIALIESAQNAHASPARALALLQKHARLYPDGMFAQEREVLAISALLTLGRRQAAEQRAERMAETYPGSLHLRRVRVLLDGAQSR
jgi:hypothetical protein